MSTASRASTLLGDSRVSLSPSWVTGSFPQLGHRCFLSTGSQVFSLLSVGVSRLVWLLAAPGMLPVPLLLRAAAVAPRCWGWEVWGLLDLPLEVWRPCGTIPVTGAGLEAAEWPDGCLVTTCQVPLAELGCSNAQEGRVGTLLTQSARTWPVSRYTGDNTANLPRQLLWQSERHQQHLAQQMRLDWNLLQEPAIETGIFLYQYKLYWYSFYCYRTICCELQFCRAEHDALWKSIVHPHLWSCLA